MTHAVVIGGSIAGMVAAKMLAAHFDRVTLIERDELPENPVPRGGVPQSRQPHVLLGRGYEVLETLFPGITSTMKQRGALSLQWGLNTRAVLMDGSHMPKFDSGVETIASSRPFLEWNVRERLAQEPKITVKGGSRVLGLVASDNHQHVTGVRLETRRGQDEEIITADLVVDASGRTSKAPAWLAALGYDQPEETNINAHWGYASRVYETPEDQRDWVQLALESPPEVTPVRGGAIFAIEGNRWIVTLSGASGAYPPTDPEGFLEFARTMPNKAVYHLIHNAKPLTPVYGYRSLDNRLRHYEKLERFPENFIVMGDAACAFNPIYGQGMSIAAVEAYELGVMLADYPDKHDLRGLSKAFQQRLSELIRDPWQISTGADLVQPGVESNVPKPSNRLVRLLEGYNRLLGEAMLRDPELMRRFLRVMHMQKPLSSMLSPVVVWRVLRYGLVKRRQNAARLQPAQQT